MNKKMLQLILSWPKPYISGTDFSVSLDKSANARHALIKRALGEYLLPIKRDLYLISSRYAYQKVDLFEIAPLIYGPSYISFESALSFHGWIPEAVITTTCACVKRSRKFKNYVGLFSYERIPLKAFHIGVGQHRKNNEVLFIAEPWKALADYLYVRKRVWPNSKALSEDLRIEMDDLQNSDKELLSNLSQVYPSARVRKALSLLFKDLFGNEL